jgi:hypothetical protein
MSDIIFTPDSIEYFIGNPYQNKVFRESRCLDKENSYKSTLINLLLDLGYQQENFDIFVRDTKCVILALVDDVEHVNYQFKDSFLHTLTSETTVITDGWINIDQPAFNVLRLPDSWYGIYSFDPDISVVHKPIRSYSLCVNRIEPLRQLIFLLLAKDGLLDRGHVNFNCNHPSIPKDCDDATLRQHRQDVWSNNLKEVNRLHWDDFGDDIRSYADAMPWRNHKLLHDQVYMMSGLNIVLETYYSDYSVSFSEKIFHALVSPRPWTLFAGSGAAARLQNLGFEVYHDLVPHHRYDNVSLLQGKIKAFYDVTKSLVYNQTLDRSIDRCQSGARHNIALLKHMQTAWPGDFANWLNQFVDAIS